MRYYVKFVILIIIKKILILLVIFVVSGMGYLDKFNIIKLLNASKSIMKSLNILLGR